jgi:hypothetical protein
LGRSSATVSRWFSGALTPSEEQVKWLEDAVTDIEELFDMFSPAKPDVSDPETTRAILKLVHENKFWVTVKSVGFEEARQLTRQEMEQAKTQYEAGVRALGNEILDGLGE